MAMSFESWNDFLGSTPFRFIIGPDKKLCTIHAALIAQQSDPLGTLVNGPMSESQAGEVILPDVDEGTFIRFGQFAYNKDYTPGNPEILLDASKIEAGDGTQADDEGWSVAVAAIPDEPLAGGTSSGPGIHGGSSSQSPRLVKAEGGPRRLLRHLPTTKPKKDLLWEEFKSQVFPHKTGFSSTGEPRKNCEPEEDYTPVFLSHARLYVFANQWNIRDLMNLTLHRLQQTLLEFTIYKERVGDVVALLQYTYEHTPPLSHNVDRLRQLVVRYAACVVEKLAGHEQFQNLLEGGLGLAKDLFAQMLKRLD
ncbi:MAG: hypothetical protein M1823_001569 [Watsoniomyces obsoletus]|nr:MAG: hypothetical protein M1823_001569 [Watsoniomyces obsoletus]